VQRLLKTCHEGSIVLLHQDHSNPSGAGAMIPPAFEYCAPTSVDEAIGLLKQHGSEAKILSGGMSLIPLLKLRLAAPRLIVDINRLPGLNYIKEADGFLKIGALTREADLERS